MATVIDFSKFQNKKTQNNTTANKPLFSVIEKIKGLFICVKKPVYWGNIVILIDSQRKNEAGYYDKYKYYDYIEIRAILYQHSSGKRSFTSNVKEINAYNRDMSHWLSNLDNWLAGGNILPDWIVPFTTPLESKDIIIANRINKDNECIAERNNSIDKMKAQRNTQKCISDNIVAFPPDNK